MPAFWEYSGFANIGRGGVRSDESMQLPVCFQSPESQPLLSPEEITQRATELAQAFLNMLELSDKKHRQDYGNVKSIEITSIVQTES